MQLPKLAIKNYQFVVILVFLGLLIGLNAFMTMPRSEDPNTTFPIYTIVAVYPGTGPEDIEELVVDPIEEVLEEIGDITEVFTTIEDGLAVLRIEAEYGIDVEEVYDEIVVEVNAIRDELPDGLYSLDIDRVNPTERVIMKQYALTSDELPYNRLHDYAEGLEYEIEKIKGINTVEIEAYPEEEVRVSLDFQEMARRNIALKQVVGILQGNNTNIPGGEIKAAGKSFTIRSSGGYKTIEAIGATVVSSNGSQVVYLRDIADVRFDYEDIRWKGRYNGERAIFVAVTQLEGENVLRLTEALDATVASFKANLPDAVQLISGFEQADAVRNRISDFFVNLIQGILLVGAVIFLFLGFRPSLVIMTVIPLSIMMAIGALDFSGYALQQISIAALVIALGLLVDNGIVVIENIVRFRKEGHSILQAAAKGTAEVGFAVVSSTITTLLAFAPLAMLNSGPGDYLRSLPVTVILVLLFSLVLALTFTPILAGKALKKEAKVRWVDRRIAAFIDKVYRPVLAFAIKRPIVIILLATASFVGSVMLFPSIGVSFFPTADKPLLLIEVETPKGSNIDATDEAVRYVEAILDTTTYVDSYFSNAGHGNPMVYYNRRGIQYKKDFGQLLVNFKGWDPARFYQTLADYRRIFSTYAGARITFKELKNGPPFRAPIEVRVLGENLDTLKVLAAELEETIRKTPGTLNVFNPLRVNKTDLKVAINRDKAGMIGLPLADIDLAVRASLAGLQVDELTMDDGEKYPLIVRMPFDEQPTIDDFNKVYFTTQAGAQVPLRQVANITYERAVTEILHFNSQRCTAVTADVVDADKTAVITQDVIAKLNDNLPEGYSYYIAGEYETQQESFGDLGGLLLVAMIGIFAVLVLQFRSLRQPLIVFSAIPLAITGSFVALYLTGWSFSFFAFVGFISLVGIVVNNSIILVDYTNQLIKSGKDKIEALMQACETRFTPIVLTTTTTILGLLPLTLSATGLWSPLGWTIIGGMVSSTFLTLLIVPILYKWLTNPATVIGRVDE